MILISLKYFVKIKLAGTVFLSLNMRSFLAIIVIVFNTEIADTILILNFVCFHMVGWTLNRLSLTTAYISAAFVATINVLGWWAHSFLIISRRI